MPSSPTIQYLTRKEVDEQRWDDCIAAAGNGRIYAFTIYLDTMCDHWGALVLNDYTAVMPLPWRRKGGLYYLYHPPLIAQLGLFGSGLTAGLLQQFLQAVPRRFRYWDFPLNGDNLFKVDLFPLYQRQNFVLPLQAAYPVLVEGYRENIRRNIKKSQRLGCTVKTGLPVSDVIALAQWQPKPLPLADGQRFARLFEKLEERGQGKTYGIVSDKGDLLASCAFVFSHRRAYYILVGNHPNGRTLGASHALIDAFIRDHAGQDLLLDFEGSDVRNLAFFYQSFGAVAEYYSAVRLNRLPWWLRWLKA